MKVEECMTASNPFDLTGKVALITGGNSGIGLGMAEAVAQAGASVCIWGTNAEKNKVALERLREITIQSEAFICDVSDEKAVETQFAATLARFGRVDACFANAGVSGERTLFHEMSTDAWRRVMSVNLDGVFFTLRAATRHMIERRDGGSLVVTSSIAAVLGAARNEHYAATKGAVTAMSMALAVELARHGITSNVIQPGLVETPMTERNYKWDKFVDAVMPRIPMRRWGQPQDFGAVAIYLMSDASRYHTGDTLLIDGGYTKF